MRVGYILTLIISCMFLVTGTFFLSVDFAHTSCSACADVVFNRCVQSPMSELFRQASESFTAEENTIATAADEQENITVIFIYNNKKYYWDSFKSMPRSKLYHYSGEIQKHGRTGDRLTRLKTVDRVREIGFDIADAFDYVFYGLGDKVREIKREIDTAPKNAEMVFHPNYAPYFTVKPHKIGYQLDLNKLYSEVYKQLSKKPNITIELKPDILNPQVFERDLKSVTHKRSGFRTNYENSSENRKHNVKKALACFNGMVLEPGVEYSFNKITGRRTEENGYREANIIIDREYVESFGGGVCQSSTTLYNALLLGGLKILEVHPHSLPSSYINLGFDAMVNYGTSDLRWINTSNKPMFIRTYFNNSVVGAEVYGEPFEDGISFKRITDVKATVTPPKDKTFVDLTGEYQDKVLYKDESFYKTYPRNGYEVDAYLEIYKDGKLQSKNFIRHVKYNPVQGVRVFGALDRPIEDVADESDDFVIYEI